MPPDNRHIAAPARSGGEPTWSRLLSQRVEHTIRQHLDADVEIRLGEVHLPSGGLFDPPANLALDLGRGQTVGLVGPAGPDPKPFDGAAGDPVVSIEVFENRRGNLLDIAPGRAGLGEIGDAEDAADTFTNGRPVGLGTETQLDSSHEGTHLLDV